MARTRITELTEANKIQPEDLLTAVSASATSPLSTKITVKTLSDSLTTVSSSISASYALSASYAANGGVTKIIEGTYINISPASGLGDVTVTGDPFPYTGNANITGDLGVTGTITAQKLVVQTITSSVIYSSGSNIFGDELTDIQQFTGSVRITGSLSLASGVASLTSSWAVSASQAISSSYPFAVTGSNTIYTTLVGIPQHISKNESIFIGQGTGISSSYAGNENDYIVAVGHNATSASSAAEGSVSIGYRAGAKSFTYEAVSIGRNAGYSASFLQGGVHIGARAGSESDMGYTVAIGSEAGNRVRAISGFSGVYYSVFVGYSAGYRAIQPGYSTVFIGHSSGQDSAYLQYSTAIGASAAQSAITASESTFVGYFSGYQSRNNSDSSFIGAYSGQSAISSSYTNTFGYYSGYNISGSTHSVLIGSGTGRRLSGTGIGPNNIIIGKNISLENGRRDSINLGAIIFATGSYSVDPSNYLVTGPFSGSINGRVGINQPLPIYSLDVSGSGNYTGELRVTGSLIANNITGSLQGTASFALNGVSIINPLNNRVLTSNGTVTGIEAESNLTFDGSTLIVNGITVGRGEGNIASNTAIGTASLSTNSTGFNNTSVGTFSLKNNSTGTSNTALGATALFTTDTGISNTGIGARALYFNLSGNYNTALGARSGYNFLGSNNTILGNYEGSGAVTSSNNNIFIADGQGNLQLFITGSTNLATFTGAVSASGFTGSLFGTSSWAVSASWAPGGGGGSITVADEGAAQGVATFLNFTGAGVTATVAANTASISITDTTVKYKAGSIANSSFTGAPRKAIVTFSTPFPNTNYGVDITGEDLRAWTIEGKLTAGFTASSNSDVALSGTTYWEATAYGETA